MSNMDPSRFPNEPFQRPIRESDVSVGRTDETPNLGQSPFSHSETLRDRKPPIRRGVLSRWIFFVEDGAPG